MSHFTKVQCQIKDISAIERALYEMGIEYAVNTTETAFGQSRKFAITIKSGGRNLPIGFVLDATTGLYHIEGDYYYSGISEAKMKEVAQHAMKYQYTDALALQGYSVTWAEDENHQLVGTCTFG